MDFSRLDVPGQRHRRGDFGLSIDDFNRQSWRFVEYLRIRDAAAFAAMMRAIQADTDITISVADAYNAGLERLERDFIDVSRDEETTRMADEDFMMPVRKSDIEVGKPLPFAVYDADRNLLLNRGVMVFREHQLETLLERGLFREEGRAEVGGNRGPPSTSCKAGENTGGTPAGRRRRALVSFETIKLMPGDALQLQPLMEGQTETLDRARHRGDETQKRAGHRRRWSTAS